MRIVLLVFAAVLLGVVPYLTSSPAPLRVKPRLLITLSVLTLAGLASGLTLILAAAVVPSNLPAEAIPAALGRCVGAAGALFAHPLGHWPHIVASVIVLLLITRLAYAAVVTVRGMRSKVAMFASLAPAAGYAVSPTMQVVRFDAPLAYSIGLFRRRVVLSDSLTWLLQPDERRAVIAHELAHVAGWHTLLLFGGRVVARAYGFLPPVRRATSHLLLGLEVAADEAAVRSSRDPLVVARALTAVAESRDRTVPANLALGSADTELALRVRRLTVDRTDRRSPVIAGAALLAVVMLVLLQGAAIAAGGQALTSAARSEETHGVCHLPHVIPRSSGAPGYPQTATRSG